MEGDIADRFVTVEYKTYASRSVKREIRRRCDVACRVYNELLDIAMTAMAEDGHVPDRYGMQTMITQMRAEDALIRSVKVDTLRDASNRLTRAFNRCGSKSARDGKPHSPPQEDALQVPLGSAARRLVQDRRRAHSPGRGDEDALPQPPPPEGR